VHGDQFDVVIEYAPWLARLGELAYHGLLSMNIAVNATRQAMGLEYWSLSAWAKRRIKQVVGFIGRFEEKLSAEARRHRVHGVVCGHIHHAADRMLTDVHYINAGDWVESCTAVVERHDGRFELVHWRSAQHS
jgi:UDP-2,3-diacylglucosamine pyrophosphatase LpxH